MPKFVNRDYILTTTVDGQQSFKPVIRRTEKGISDYANRMFRKYGDTVTVDVGYFMQNTQDLVWIPFTTYHA